MRLKIAPKSRQSHRKVMTKSGKVSREVMVGLWSQEGSEAIVTPQGGNPKRRRAARTHDAHARFGTTLDLWGIGLRIFGCEIT